jgi:hypothetical protein
MGSDLLGVHGLAIAYDQLQVERGVLHLSVLNSKVAVAIEYLWSGNTAKQKSQLDYVNFQILPYHTTLLHDMNTEFQ